MKYNASQLCAYCMCNGDYFWVLHWAFAYHITYVGAPLIWCFLEHFECFSWEGQYHGVLGILVAAHTVLSCLQPLLLNADSGLMAHPLYLYYIVLLYVIMTLMLLWDSYTSCTTLLSKYVHASIMYRFAEEQTDLELCLCFKSHNLPFILWSSRSCYHVQSSK